MKTKYVEQKYKKQKKGDLKIKMNIRQNVIKKEKGITLIALVITIIMVNRDKFRRK